MIRLRAALLALGFWLAGALAAPAAAADAAPPPQPVALAAPAAPAERGEADAADPPATLRILNRDLVTLRTRLLGLTPAQRVERALERLRAMPDGAGDEPLNFVAVTMDGQKGTQFLLGARLVFTVLEGDVDAEAGQRLEALVAATRARVEDLQRAWQASRDRGQLLAGLARTLAATLVLGVLTLLTWRGSHTAVARMERLRDELAAVHAHVDGREFLARVAVGTLQLVQWAVLAALVYAWLVFVFASFVVTVPIARSLGDWLWGQAGGVAGGALQSLPGLATAAIVLVVTRAVADVLRYLFEMLQQGRLQVKLVHPETVPATRRILTLVIWGIGIAAAYPYLPGASSEAFRGLSVFAGLMITLGSSGLVTQAMSGLVLVYSRALRKGDFVDINGVQGVVSEIAALATKVVTVRNEEITIPNAVVVSTPIRNFSKLGGSQGTLMTTRVTVGYDASWRQVHALLISAARATPHVLATPEPYVYQRALSDFYVEYELFCSIDDPRRRHAALSDLHGSIQDTFNAAGLQIMSPHFMAQPDHPVVVPQAGRQAPAAGGTA